MTTSQKAEVDAYVLAASNLRTTSRGYKALKILFEHGNLLYCYLGKWDTLELTKLLIHLKFNYEFVTGGIQLCENSKSDFYYTIMHYKAPEARTKYRENTTKRVGKDEREDGKLGWADRKRLNNL